MVSNQHQKWVTYIKVTYYINKTLQQHKNKVDWDFDTITFYENKFNLQTTKFTLILSTKKIKYCFSLFPKNYTREKSTLSFYMLKLLHLNYKFFFFFPKNVLRFFKFCKGMVIIFCCFLLKHLLGKPFQFFLHTIFPF